MEKLPLELWWVVFDEIFEENPANLYRLRAVCNNWKTCIDQYFPSLYKKWHDICVQDIPEDCIDNILTTRYPMAAFPWQDSYWKTAQLPHIPRGIYQAWMSTSQLEGGKYETIKIPSILTRRRHCDHADQLPDAVYAINDKYLAIERLLSEESTDDDKNWGVCIYKLTDLTRPIRKYSNMRVNHVYNTQRCLQIDFYTVENREFIIFTMMIRERPTKQNQQPRKSTGGYQPIELVCMSEFLKDNKLLKIGLRRQYRIIQNECFSWDTLDFYHYTLSDKNELTINQKVVLPDDSSCRYRSIKGMLIKGTQLQIIVDYRFTKSVWFFNYNISQDLNGNLHFSPNEKDFMQVETRNDFPVSLERIMSSNFSKHLWLTDLLRPRFMTWLCSTLNNNSVHYSIIIHGDQLFVGTKTGRIFILHQTIDEIIQDFVEGKSTGTFTEINLHKLGVRKHVLPIEVKYVGSRLRIIALDPDNILCIDYPLTD